MKTKLTLILTAISIALIPIQTFAQQIELGTAAHFVIFTKAGAVGDNPSAHSHLTGDIGYETSGAFTGFGNVNGVMHPGVDGATTAAGLALQSAIVQINNRTVTDVISGLLGNGDTLTPGVYSIPVDAVLNLNLTLNALGNSDAEFIFKIGGTFNANTNSKIKLINGAKACRVFWKVAATVDFASGATLRGTFISGAAMSMATGDTLEGRLLTTVGAINMDGALAYMPIGCGSPVLAGPAAPVLGATACFAVFSGNGAVSNSGATYVTGDVGSDIMMPSGFLPQNVTGEVRGSDTYTAAAASGMPTIYNYLDLLPFDIQLYYPAQFGNNLVLTPHTYLLDEGTVFTDTLYLDAEDNSDAVFVIQVNGALTTTANSNVKLINGTQAKNVYWVVDGAVSILGNSKFNGTVVSNSGAIDLDATTRLDGRILSTSGEITLDAINAVATNIPSDCSSLVGVSSSAPVNEAVTIYPNPFRGSTTITINNAAQSVKATLIIYNALGAEVLSMLITNQTTTIDAGVLPAGMYFYTLSDNKHTIQSGKLIAQ
ncbi:MAG: ice-binding family protein [Bacteroidia bacterium]